MRWVLLLSVSFLAMACSNEMSSLQKSLVSDEDARGGEVDPSPTPPSPSQPGIEFIDEKLFICSNLDFTGMKAPEDLTDMHINMFALALNISSSFEGRQGWKNITNNFDGMGLSLGLLNQTLGTGTLQPLLLKMLQHHDTVMHSHYTTVNYTSLKTMALTWKDATGYVVTALNTTEDLFAPNGAALSTLDEGEIYSPNGAAETQSVNWAKQNLYTDTAGRNFKPEWKAQLQSMAGSSEYRDLQFEAARALHDKAKGYVSSFGLRELRSYLFMFDIVVQNGGFYQQNFTDYRNFIAANPNATEEQKLRAILTSRLVQVRAEYREDVRARKEGLINGRGVVHQTNRNFEQEYCYRSLDTI